jgi:hypothetical protein
MLVTRVVKDCLHIQRVVHERMVIGQKEEYIPTSDDIETRILKIRRDKLIPDSSEWMVLLSFATYQMARCMSMYPQVWFMDFTTGMYILYIYKLYLYSLQFYTIRTYMIRTLSHPRRDRKKLELAFKVKLS